jgi:hypothetical protein
MAKRKVSSKRSSVGTSKKDSMTPTMQFAVAFIIVAAIALAAFVGKNFL